MGLFRWLFPQEEVAATEARKTLFDHAYKRQMYKSWIYPAGDAIRDIKSRINDLDKGREGILKAALSVSQRQMQEVPYGNSCVQRYR